MLPQRAKQSPQSHGSRVYIWIINSLHDTAYSFFWCKFIWETPVKHTLICNPPNFYFYFFLPQKSTIFLFHEGCIKFCHYAFDTPSPQFLPCGEYVQISNKFELARKKKILSQEFSFPILPLNSAQSTSKWWCFRASKW